MPQMMNKPFDIRRGTYAMASKDGNTAEITLYGDVVEKRPKNWWTDKPVEGNFIVQDEFLEDLKACEGCAEVTIRLNSYGGDAVVGMLIHNRLRELSRAGTKLKCIVDAVAMSAGSVIMCACDDVQVNEAALVMIHKGWRLFFGGYNADELRSEADVMDRYDTAMAAVYHRKSGIDEEECLAMMSETTYLTGREAVEKGFANTLIADAEPAKLAASADRSCLYVGGMKMHIAPGMMMPDFIPIMEEPEAVEQAKETQWGAAPETEATPAEHNADCNNSPHSGKEGVNSMNEPKTVEELTEKFPALVAQVKAAAVADERARLQAIEQIAPQIEASLVTEAKYGEQACDAATLALRAMKRNSVILSKAVTDIEEDALASGAADVQAASNDVAAGDDETPEAMKADAKNVVAELRGGKE